MTVDGSRRGENAMVLVAVVLTAIAGGVLMATAAGDGRIADAPLELGWLWLVVKDGQENREFGHGLTSVPARAVARCRRPLVSLSGAVQGWQGEHVGGN